MTSGELATVIAGTREAAVDALIVSITPDRQLEPGIKRFEAGTSVGSSCHAPGRTPRAAPRGASATAASVAVVLERPGDSMSLTVAVKRRSTSRLPWPASVLPGPASPGAEPAGKRTARILPG